MSISKMAQFSFQIDLKTTRTFMAKLLLDSTDPKKKEEKNIFLALVSLKLHSYSVYKKPLCLGLLFCAFKGGCVPTARACHTHWKNEKSNFFPPENNWSQGQLWVAHTCEVRVWTDQHKQTFTVFEVNLHKK